MLLAKRLPAVADLGGGDGGDASFHQPKSSDFGRKISLYFEQFGSISGCIPPTSRNPRIPVKTFFFFFLETTRFWAKKTLDFPISAEKSLSNLVKTFFFFFFFFFGDHLILGEKTFEFPISAEKSLSIPVKTSQFLRICAQNPSPPKFSGSATGYQCGGLGKPIKKKEAKQLNSQFSVMILAK